MSRADAVMVLTMFIWGANIVSAKIAVRALPPLGFGVVRYLLAGSILLALLGWRERSVGLRRADIPAVVLAGVVGIGLNQAGFLLGIHLISASLSAIILSTTPLLTASMAALWAREPLSRLAIVALAISLCGVVMAILGGGSRISASGTGALLTLGAATTLGLGAILAKRPLRSYTALRVTTWLALCGGATLLPAGLPALLATPRTAVTSAVVAATAFTVLGSTVVGQLAWNYAIQRLGASRTAAYTYLQPVVGIAIAAILLGERLHALQVLGGVVVVLGLALYTVNTRWMAVNVGSAERGTREYGPEGNGS